MSCVVSLQNERVTPAGTARVFIPCGQVLSITYIGILYVFHTACIFILPQIYIFVSIVSKKSIL